MVHAQGLVVALIVLVSAVYAGWSLMPAGLRSRLASALLRQEGLPLWCQSRLHRFAAPATGSCGGCGGCDAKAPGAIGEVAQAAAPQPIVFHKHIRR